MRAAYLVIQWADVVWMPCIEGLCPLAYTKGSITMVNSIGMLMLLAIENVSDFVPLVRTTAEREET